MILQALNKDYKHIGYVSEYIELAWRPRFYDTGEFSLYIPSNLFNPEIAYLTYKNNTAVVQKIEFESGYNGEFITASGLFSEFELADGVVYPTFFVSPSSSVTSEVERCIRTYCTLDLDIFQASTEKVETQKTGGTVHEFMKNILPTYDIGTFMYYDLEHEKYVLEMTKGADRTIASTDKPVILSRSFGTIPNAKVSNDVSGFKNFAVVAGAGEGSARVWVTVDQSNGTRKRKMWVDANDLQREDGQSLISYKNALIQRGKEKLREARPQITVDCDTIHGYTFGTDFALGDYVTLQIKEVDLEQTVQIVGVDTVVKAGKIENKIILG